MNTRHRLIICCSLLLMAASWARPASAQEVEWRSDYARARKEAQDKDRPLVIDFSTVNCFWCRQLEQRTFTDPAVITLLNEHCVPLHLDAGAVPELVEKMNIHVYPTLVYAAANGRILGFQEGFIEAPVFRDQVQRTVNAVSAPEWMGRDYEAAQQAVAAKDYPRATTLLKGVMEDGKERPVQAKAKQLLQELEAQAANELKAAQEKAARGQAAAALKATGEVTKQFAGTLASREAADLQATLTARTDAGDQQRKERARDLLAQAHEDYRTQQFLCCLDRCEALISQFAELPEAAEAVRLSSDIKSNPEWAKQAADQMSDRLGLLYLSLAETCLKKGQPQEAVYYLERVVQNFPNSRHAETAQVRLAQIQGQPVSRAVDFKK